MRGPMPRRSGWFLALSGAVAAALVVAAGGGARRSPPDVAQLRAQAASLASRSHEALLALYSAETQLTAASTREAALEREVAQVRTQRALVAREVAIAAHAQRVSERRLASHLKALYEQGQPDPLATILGASSLDDALSSLAALDRVASQDRIVVATAISTRRRLGRLSAKLAARTAQLDGARQQAATAVAVFRQAREQRFALVSSLQSRQRLTRGRIAELEAVARAADAKTQQLTVAAQPQQAPPPDAAAGGEPASPPVDQPAAAPAPGDRTLTVVATGYAMRGRTATGLPVGWGIVAVDPSLIPLGTHMTIPGYGDAVAADTGGSVRGATIDLWFPTLAQARAWGRRTVTITLH